MYPAKQMRHKPPAEKSHSIINNGGLIKPDHAAACSRLRALEGLLAGSVSLLWVFGRDGSTQGMFV